MTTLRTIWKNDPGLVVSGGAHVLALIFLLVNFERPPHLDDAIETIPVEMITTDQLNEVMSGEKTAKQMQKPQRRVDKEAELEERHPAPPLAEARKDTPPPPAPEKANDDPGPDTTPPKPVAVLPPPPPPVPTPPRRPIEKAAPPTPPERPVEKAETPPPTPPERPIQKAEAPTPPARPEPEKPPPPDAEAVAPKPPPRPKREAKKEVKKPAKPVKVAKVEPTPPPPPPPVRPEPPRDEPKPQAKTFDMVARLLDKLKPDPTPPSRPRAGNEATDQPHHDFSFDKITALLDHEAPQHKASTGRQLTQLASLGSPTSHADKMSPTMMAQLDGWLIDHYRGCWSYFGLGATQSYVPAVRVKMAQDGSLMGKPALMNPPSDPNLRSLADSALRAVNRCDPLPIPDRYKPFYSTWRDRVVRFDPKEMS